MIREHVNCGHSSRTALISAVYGNMPRPLATAVQPSMRTLFLTLLAAGIPLLAQAQSTCSSDGQAPSLAVYERFINADCATCWGQAAAHPPGPSALVLDWVVPGSAGDDAPLSAVASTDAQTRLGTLQRLVPMGSDTHIAAVVAGGARASRPARLRVAHGLPFNDYLGTLIAFTPAAATHGRAPSSSSPSLPSSSGPWNFYLLLVESVPAGSEGTPVDRHLVRNVFTGTWGQEAPGRKRVQRAWQEARPARIPDGARVDRLRMVGWVQDAQGNVVAATQSDCRQ